MVHYKLILNDKRESKEQVYSVVVRITFNKNNTTLSTGIRVKREDWDSVAQKVLKSHPNFQVLNKTISEFYIKIQKVIHQLDDADELSFSSLKERLDEKAKPYKKQTNITFNEYSTQIINELFAINKVGNALVQLQLLNYLSHLPLVSIIPPSLVFSEGKTYHWTALQALLQ